MYFDQNYSYNHIGKNKCCDWETGFINFISQLKLQFLMIHDEQSHFFSTFDWDYIMKKMPEISEYIIESNTCSYSGYPNQGCDKIKVLKSGMKTLKLHIHP